MLTREIMGALALGILWVNTLLIAAATLKLAGGLRRRLGGLRPLVPGEEGRGLLRARVEEGLGEGASIARLVVEQVGRAGAERGGRRTIHFGDRTFAGELLGGEVVAGNVRVRVPAARGEVWPERGDVRASAGCAGQARFDEVYEEARKARGHARKVCVHIAVGATVWLGGVVRREGDGFEIEAPPGGEILVSAIDPRAWLRSKLGLAAAFVLAELAFAGGVTALALSPPRFDGWVSLLGGVLGLGYFLAVQPVGTAVRDALRPPSTAFVRGVWIEGASPREGEVSASGGDASTRAAGAPRPSRS